ncbi:MAG: hypothetical protein ACR2QE_17595, partial [Acidimicrobiales bacterium]
MASPRGFAVLLLAVAGALTGHWLGTTFAAPAELVDHSYLGATGALFTPFVIAAFVWLAVKGARTTGGADLDIRVLLVLQLAVFTGQETIELLSAGLPVTQLLTEPAILIGFVVQVPLALLIRGLVRAARTIVAALADRPGPIDDLTRTLAPSTLWMPDPI